MTTSTIATATIVRVFAVAGHAGEQLPSVDAVVVTDVEAEESSEECPPQLRLDVARRDPVEVAPQAGTHRLHHTENGDDRA
jgi:hypothetical protein